MPVRRLRQQEWGRRDRTIGHSHASWGVVERNGDFEAFGAGHGRRLIHLAEPLLGDRGAAEDLTQDVLARAYLRWDRVERDDPYAYVRRALINARIDRWRRRLPIPVADLGPDRVVADHAQGRRP